MFYDQFYRKYGIRKEEQLVTPPLPKLGLLELPKNSIYHYVAASPLDVGPASDEYLFSKITRPIMMEHVKEIGATLGTPRRLSVAVDPLIRGYHIKNRRFRLMRSLDASARDINTLVVVNYAVIPQLYRYVRSYYTEYYKWWNIQAAVWKKIGALSAVSDRAQFISCKLPLVLPSVPDLNLSSGDMTQHTVKIFNNPDSLLVLELWKWFGADRKSSVISNVPDTQLKRINLIFQESGRWFVLNLGLLNSWRIATKEELALNPEANKKGLLPAQLQRRFLRLLVSLFQVRTVVAKDGIKTPAAKDIEVKVVIQTSTLPEVNKDTGAMEVKTQEQELPDEAAHETGDAAGPDSHGDDITHDEEFERQLAADLAELETISKAHIGPHEDAVTKTPPLTKEALFAETPTLEEGVMRVCDRLADTGSLSAAEYRRYNTLASTYKNIPSPDGKTTLDKFIQVTSEQLKIESSTTIKDIPNVVDKSMLKSSLHDFDQRYIKEVLARDVAGMVLNIQNAGIAITNYEVERIEDVMGSFDLHTVRVTPVEGAASTFRFKLPAIEDDGTYQANGTKYRMRKQRGDKHP